MTACDFEKYFDEYILGQLPAAKDLEFQAHLSKCPACTEKLDEFYQIHHLLKMRVRPQPSQQVKSDYYHQLKISLLINAPVQKFSSLVERVVFTASPWMRVAQVVVILVIGILIGTVFLTGEAETRSIPVLEQELFSQPVSKVDMEFMNYYLSASEIILLELMNSGNDAVGLKLTKEVSQKLLMKTFLVHEIALRISEPETLRFLSLMEMILYDLANTAPNEIEESMRNIRSLIREKKLLQAVQLLQKRFKNSGSPPNLPG